ncbi:ABC transporter permease [Desulfitobacterium chlororespirans]|uniref:Putative ABC transport system permease protein n=1 Tax=Desulfitobacterium chlororespirans DSM 11544 TaxID=1121395 RepID=A0A1M7SLU8_9FIRM|nr:ABC transporter permease [Desulfitobacterium chlororespirans]SHN59447.1 putative ABC transport system permease protein [Desulfitobacterium chlororespirans DSM 11544]
MNFLELMKVSLRALYANKLRSALTMLGIIIGVFAVIIMVAIANGATQSVTANIQGLGSNLLIVSAGQSSFGGVRGGAGSANTLTMEDVAKVRAAGSAVKAVAPVVNTNAQVVYGTGNTSTSVMGTTAEYADVRSIKITQGRFITEEDITKSARVAVVGPTVVENLFGDANADIIGKNIKLNNIPYQVVGVTVSQGSSGMTNNDDMIYAPISSVQSRLVGSKSVRQIYIEAESAQLMTEAQDQVTYALQLAHKIQSGQENDFTITNQAEVLESMEEISQTMTLLLGGIAGISLLVGGIGVMNIMLVSVTERTREIGIRKAIGAGEGDILFQFLIESVVLSLIGGMIGILLGWGGSLIASELFGVTASVSPSSVGIAFGFSALIGIVFGVVPAKKAAAMNPIEALRYE